MRVSSSMHDWKPPTQTAAAALISLLSCVICLSSSDCVSLTTLPDGFNPSCRQNSRPTLSADSRSEMCCVLVNICAKPAEFVLTEVHIVQNIKTNWITRGCFSESNVQWVLTDLLLYLFFKCRYSQPRSNSPINRISKIDFPSSNRHSGKNCLATAGTFLKRKRGCSHSTGLAHVHFQCFCCLQTCTLVMCTFG